MLTRVDGQTSRRAFLGLAAAGVAGAVSACSDPVASKPKAATARAWRNPVPENSLPGTGEWVIRNLGADHEIEGYAGLAGVPQGESSVGFPILARKGHQNSEVSRHARGQG